MGNGVGVFAGGDESAVVGHIAHVDGSDFVSDLADASEIEFTRVSGGARYYDFWLGFDGDAVHLIVVNEFGFGVDSIGCDVVELSAEIDG